MFIAFNHCAPLAKNLNMLLLDDMYSLISLCFMYKVYYALCCSVIQCMFFKCSNVHDRVTRGSEYNFYVYPCNNSQRHQSIFHSGVVAWNLLQSNIRSCSCFTRFKMLVKKQILNNYWNPQFPFSCCISYAYDMCHVNTVVYYVFCVCFMYFYIVVHCVSSVYFCF